MEEDKQYLVNDVSVVLWRDCSNGSDGRDRGRGEGQGKGRKLVSDDQLKGITASLKTYPNG